jgi:hypothetical protein
MTTKTKATQSINAIHAEVTTLFSKVNGSAEAFKKNNEVFGEAVKGVDSRASGIMILGLEAGMLPAEIGKEFFAFEKDTLKHFDGTPRLKTMKQFFANLRRVIPSLNKPIAKTDKGADILGKDALKNAKGEIVPLQTASRKFPTAKGAQANDKKVAVIEVTDSMLEYASLLAGECDWDKSLANKVLAHVFAEAKKADSK